MNKKSIESSNPFVDIEHVTNTISDIVALRTKVVFRSNNGLIVSLPDDDTSLLQGAKSDEIINMSPNDVIDIYYDAEGNSYKDNGKYEVYKNILSKASNGHVFNAIVIDITKQGLLVSVEGLQCFLPEGQIGVENHTDLRSFVSQTIEVKLISVKLKEKEGNRFLPIVSHKILTEERNLEKINTLSIGSIVNGIVKNIENYGVFVTLLPSIDGLIHITDLSWERISNPTEIVSVGQSITVKILDIKQNKGKTNISLGLKQLTQKPWERFDRNIKEGDIVTGPVCNIMDFGVFLKLSCGIQGFIHKSELAWDTHISSKDFSIGQTLTAKIIKIDWEQEKLLLSLKQMTSDPWSSIDEKIAVGNIVDVTIKSFTNFGVFVKIVDGIEGLIHVSELSWIEKIKKPKDIYNVDDRLKAVILSIDKDKRKIELSFKQVSPNPWLIYQTGQQVNATVDNIAKNGIQVKIVGTNLPAFIPSNFSSHDLSIEESSKLICEIKEIDLNKKRIILAIL
ncbi:MAG: S1 RNA-binding domain-containing protein [Prevotella salivae]|uniref:S1 RNA-binding domain-containing protein n=1 Tax=Segatella salivae TaxID=228604 RepID=UPI001CAB13D2|nr:S1 RNA-binding domain-containing protein [Segatella salivae]MBF1545304.1 S1 RNA-binding domain-containing protein [Segatella salivae]